MKIIFDVPETTCAAFLNFVFETETGMQMGIVSAGSKEIESGEIIQYEWRPGHEHDAGRSDS